VTGRLRRLLFASVHGYVDPSSGAACATRDVLELMAACGVECRVVSTGILDFGRQTSLGPLVAAVGGPDQPSHVSLSGSRSARVYAFALGGVHVTLMETTSSLVTRSPDRTESVVLLDLVGREIERFQPQVILTYGGHAANLELMARARKRGIPVVFHLHNLAYTSRSVFTNATAVLVPSEYSRRHYARRLGLECLALPLPVIPARVVAPEPTPKYVTFINPQPAKGAAVFARIAAEMAVRRPEIPFLVVDGRGMADGLAGVRLDLSELRNLHRIPNTPSPRAIYRLSRAVLVPSVVAESFGWVAAEGLANGLPVVASDRGALPETLGDAGFAFTLPERCDPSNAEVPTAQEVAPWVATIERLWDAPEWEAWHQSLAREAARRFGPDLLAEKFLSSFAALVRS
jgi:glycosyltransferase involved in cell wall biosynthesis